MHSTSFLIFISLLLPFIFSTPHIDWCLYWRYLNKDLFRPECNGIYRLRFAKHKVLDHKLHEVSNIRLKPQPPAQFQNRLSSPQSISISPAWISQGFGQCQNSWSNCRPSSSCNSGHLCVDASGYCCGTPPKISHCPSPDSLAQNCRARRHYINWCNYDFECAPKLALRQNAFYSDSTPGYHNSAAVSLCCPTQCGYNMCVS